MTTHGDLSAPDAVGTPATGGAPGGPRSPGTPASEPPGPAGASWAQSLAILLGRRMWDRRAHSWDSHRSPGLQRVVEAVLTAAGAGPGMVAVDLGCGTGQLALPMARSGAKVTAVDVSPRMIERLDDKARGENLSVEGVVAPVEKLDLAPASVDLVVSNYAMHHVPDSAKAAVVRAAASWLRPGGRLVVGDMMFGRGASARDREIISAKARTMLRRGPAGWWRLAKNVARFTVRYQERPVPVETWVKYFTQAGLTGVRATPVVAEAAIVVGTKA